MCSLGDEKEGFVFVSTVPRNQRKGLCAFWLLAAIFKSATLLRLVGT